MALARHKQALRGMVSRPRILTHVAVAAAVTLAVVSAGVAASLPGQVPAASSTAMSAAAPPVRTSPVPVRVAPISRSAQRVRLEEKPPKVVGHLFATAALNVRLRPSEESARVGSLAWAEKVPVSGVTRGDWAEVVIDGESRWVHGAYLSETRPRPEPEEEPASAPVPTGLSTAPCASGSDVESGLVAHAVAVHRAVCAAFPSVTSYGGYRPDDGEHATGQALDIMVTGAAGWEIADFVGGNAGALGVSEVLYAQKIWTVERSSEGWRWMEDRGSSTANHYDHVHVTVY